MRRKPKMFYTKMVPTTIGRMATECSNIEALTTAIRATVMPMDRLRPVVELRTKTGWINR